MDDEKLQKANALAGTIKTLKTHWEALQKMEKRKEAYTEEGRRLKYNVILGNEPIPLHPSLFPGGEEAFWSNYLAKLDEAITQCETAFTNL